MLSWFSLVSIHFHNNKLPLREQEQWIRQTIQKLQLTLTNFFFWFIGWGRLEVVTNQTEKEYTSETQNYCLLLNHSENRFQLRACCFCIRGQSPSPLTGMFFFYVYFYVLVSCLLVCLYVVLSVPLFKRCGWGARFIIIFIII